MAETKACFVVEAAYADDATESRAPYREQHLERVERLMTEGTLLLAGAYDDMSASLLILDVADEKQAREIAESDVYWREGIWTEITVLRLNRVVRV